jgi:hypothetical protein
VYRVAPHPDEPDLLPSAREGGILGNRSLTVAELDRLFAAGASVEARTATDGADRPTGVPLFAVTRAGRLSVAADGRPPQMRPGDTVVYLVPAAQT